MSTKTVLKFIQANLKSKHKIFFSSGIPICTALLLEPHLLYPFNNIFQLSTAYFLLILSLYLEGTLYQNEFFHLQSGIDFELRTSWIRR